MGRKTKPYQKKAFESTGVSSDTSANIYMSMLLSPAWKALSSQQKVLYLCCKSQYYGEKRKPKTEESPEGCLTYFTMNKSKWCSLFELYKDNNRAGFYRDKEALIKNGFIVCVQSGKNTRTKSIYGFSDEWRRYGTEEFCLRPSAMNSSMLKKLREKKL